ncbi:hypothetical protein COU15_00850 [Candidatus Kaiserbacteria bacterium CG10_big_fil_rev_8_21_14_0_10_45_20]|uniref:tRNA pseudouridine(55) synthase n=1 Tax=Candidatus Kaiserbacteria bacterium CG10_big_fil_rev_8_21_14_0_10_45_20 TaxID=1974607 RepID=A0A2H0UG30_9BACT|nr:MAG: hypothetical protein COU15_00850 [Candidatus Kaiserbacteria bacterium CG10_big_fil_rev_8_21_14_0_10_45_20]
MTSSWVVLEKKIGETPLSVIEAWRKKSGIAPSTPLSYAGRLDPMASGKLLVLIGEECKKQKEYTGLDKEYEVEVLFSVSTDTGDVLGLPQIHSGTVEVGAEAVESALEREVGSHTREYPVFSSKTVEGKPLFLYALEKNLDSITIPTHTETVYAIEKSDVVLFTKENLASRIASVLSVVPRTDEASKALGADFRQDEVRNEWKKAFDATDIEKFFVLPIRVVCASGTYMRTLAPRIGESLKTRAIALSIHRTKIGRYSKEEERWVEEFNEQG